jgi:hypothetical protein
LIHFHWNFTGVGWFFEFLENHHWFQFFRKNKKVQNPENLQFFDLRNLKPTVNIPKPGI